MFTYYLSVVHIVCDHKSHLNTGGANKERQVHRLAIFVLSPFQFEQNEIDRWEDEGQKRDVPIPLRSKSTIYFPQNSRPEIPSWVSEELSSLMQECWDRAPEKRPEFTKVVETLERYLEQLTSEAKTEAKVCCALM